LLTNLDLVCYILQKIYKQKIYKQTCYLIDSN